MRAIRTVLAGAVAAAAATFIPAATTSAQTPQGSGFTYQGLLFDGGVVADGTFDLRFTVFNAANGGMQLAPAQTILGVSVTDGRFTVVLDFGKPIFDAGNARWLEIAVSDGGPFIGLAPRQRITPAPAAIFAQNASQAKPSFRIFDADNDPGAGTLFFGSTDLCTIQAGGGGLTASDPGGVRIVNPLDELRARLRFGPTDDCGFEIDPQFPGLIERDPVGLRLLDPANIGGRLLFGPTDQCFVEAGFPGPAGLRLYDPFGIRICRPPLPFPGPFVLWFGDDDLCSLFADPQGPGGLTASDPAGLRIVNPLDQLRARLRFGPTDDCGFEIDPRFPGLIERDPVGLRLLDPGNTGGRLLFGPTFECGIEAGLGLQPGLRLRDPGGVRIINPLGEIALLTFGESDLCSIKAGGGGGGAGGMTFGDPFGFLFQGGFVGLNVSQAEVGLQLPPAPGPAGIALAVAFETYSSRRFKENIVPIEDPLGLIARLQGVRFDWIENGRHDIGFIAEEVAAVLPEVVQMEEDGVNARSLDYARLTALAIEGIKAQQAEIEVLERENEALRGEVGALRSEIEDLRKLVERVVRAH